MPGDREAAVTEVKSFDLHGVTDYDLALIFSEGARRAQRLGPEGVPDGLRASDGVLVMMAANMVFSLRRP